MKKRKVTSTAGKNRSRNLRGSSKNFKDEPLDKRQPIIQQCSGGRL